MDKLQARKTAYRIAAELMDDERAREVARANHLIETEDDAQIVAEALAELREELVERAELDDDDPELAERYRKLNAQLEQDDHGSMIEKLRSSAAFWDRKLSE